MGAGLRTHLTVLSGLLFYTGILTIVLTLTVLTGNITVIGPYFIVPLFIVLIFFGIQDSPQVHIPALTILCLFILWVALGALRSPQPTRAFTLVGIVSMGAIIFVGLSLGVRDRKTLHRLNKWIYGVGALLATIGIAGYFAVVFGWVSVSNGFDNYVLFAMPAHGILYRYTGFVGAPNLYPLYATPSFVAGIVAVRGWRRIGLLPLGLSILLAMSRTFFIVITVAIGVSLIMFRRDLGQQMGRIFRQLSIGIAAVTVTVLTFGYLL